MDKLAERGPLVLVVGLVGNQHEAVEEKVGCLARLKFLTADKALKLRGGDVDLVVVTRFVKHKHTIHLRRVLGSSRVRFVERGAASAVADAVQSALRQPHRVGAFPTNSRGTPDAY